MGMKPPTTAATNESPSTRNGRIIGALLWPLRDATREPGRAACWARAAGDRRPCPFLHGGVGVLIHHAAVEEVDGALSVQSVSRVVGDHADGRAFPVELLQQA